jgi:hypothetical protein
MSAWPTLGSWCGHLSSCICVSSIRSSSNHLGKGRPRCMIFRAIMVACSNPGSCWFSNSISTSSGGNTLSMSLLIRVITDIAVLSQMPQHNTNNKEARVSAGRRKHTKAADQDRRQKKREEHIESVEDSLRRKIEDAKMVIHEIELELTFDRMTAKERRIAGIELSSLRINRDRWKYELDNDITASDAAELFTFYPDL